MFPYFQKFSPPLTVSLSQDIVNEQYMKVVYLTTKTIEIKPYTICLGLEVERPEPSTAFSFFRYFTRYKKYLMFSGSIYRAYEVSYPLNEKAFAAHCFSVQYQKKLYR